MKHKLFNCKIGAEKKVGLKIGANRLSWSLNLQYSAVATAMLVARQETVVK